ncbi:MAG: transglutaminase domain-containing protein [Deltaproteobacteria bacterium]|nr:transglutaminase domain-containing protein [Deltaproteobacteria bacterium]
MSDPVVMSGKDSPPADYLKSTHYIESRAKQIVKIASGFSGLDAVKKAIALFEFVRDHIKYDPYCAMDPPEMYRATMVLKNRKGYCVQKAVLLAALGRAAGIPTRLGFADVRNHKTPAALLEIMGTNLFVFHGYVEFWIKNKWIKATPAFDRETARKAGALLVELDGEHDAVFHPVDPYGQPHIEYVNYRGVYSDLPIQEIIAVFKETYGEGNPSTTGHSGSGEDA